MGGLPVRRVEFAIWVPQFQAHPATRRRERLKSWYNRRTKLLGGDAMDQRLIDLYHDYAHVHFDRRVFLERAARIVGSVSAAAALLPLLAPDDAKAAMVPPDDQRITAERVTFPGATGPVK